MITLHSYEFLEDAWQDGVAAWCQAASPHVLSGGRAWMVTVSDGQANWIKRRLLQQGVSLFGLQFFNAASLRRELCLRRGVPTDLLGNHPLSFTLRLRALAQAAAHPETAAVARHPGVCLAALDDFAAAGWLTDDPAWRHEILPPVLDGWLAEVQAQGLWTPEIDRRLLVEAAASPASALPPLALCVCGWDASCWPAFQLLAAAVREAQSSRVYAPLPRGSSENIQLDWLTALEECFDEGFEPCASVDFSSTHQALVSRLEGADLSATDEQAIEPELLVGLDAQDAAVLARDFVARWLAGNGGTGPAPGQGDGDRLVILSPRRDLSAVALLRGLAAAGIDVEDELGEVPEPSLAVQIQRAILAYHQDNADIDGLMAIVDLLNEHVAIWDGQGANVLRAVFPLDPAEVRRLLHTAFGDVQHHSVRVLSDVFAQAHSAAARPLRALVEHLGEWPEKLAWPEALARWESCLAGLGLSTDLLEPLWSQLGKLPLRDPVPASAFFQFLAGILDCAPARRSPDGRHRYARVVLTTLDGAMGQSWGAALFLDSNEGAWPLYPSENAFLDDALRARLNQRRSEYKEGTDAPWRGYLLTSVDRAQLEHFRFMEILGHCTGPVAFAGLARDPVEPGQELYANEWALRCLLEAGKPLAEGEKLLDRWHGAIRRTKRLPPRLAKGEREHLRAVFDARRNVASPFDEYAFNFEALGAADELPWTDAWSVRDLETAWNHPATFALKQIFGATPTHSPGREFMRGEGWMVGRLVHQWLRAVLGARAEPRRMSPHDWEAARSLGLAAARHGTEDTLRAALARQRLPSSAEEPLPLWWRSTLQKAEWAAGRCLEALAGVACAGSHGESGVWLIQDRRFHADIGTAGGPLRLQAHCDLVFSDQPELAGASCQMIDIRTGAAPSAGAHSADRLGRGEGLNLAALMFLAVKEGAQAEDTRIGVVHPDAVNTGLLTAESKDDAAPALWRLADQQRALNFGQRGNPAAGDGPARDGETLPLATVAIDPAVLAGKFSRPPSG